MKTFESCLFAAIRASALLLLAALAACGGGGTAGSSGPVVSSARLISASARYSQPLTITILGSNLDQGVAVSSSACKNATLSADPSQLSTATTAYYQCTVSSIGAGTINITRTSDGTLLQTISFNAPAPVVTITVDNGAGVTGVLFVTLAPDKAPITVDNFLSYVSSGFYVGTLFHRVAPGFVVQGGGYVAPLTAAPGSLKATRASIPLETGVGLSNTQWAIAMARTSGDANSATSQFFIDLEDNSALLDPSPINGPGYAVFGVVSAGTSAVTAIVHSPCVAIPLFLPTGECTPIPNMVITSTMQTQ